MDLGHQGKSVVVTGGASNIGRAITLGFVAEGANVTMGDLDAEQSERVVEVARADQVFEKSELVRLLELITSHFALSPEDAADLIDSAADSAEDIVDLHEFTRLLHGHLADREKEQIVGMLWQIAYADGRLDKYENSLVLKISDLLYVSRGRVMRLKHDAETAASD